MFKTPKFQWKTWLLVDNQWKMKVKAAIQLVSKTVFRAIAELFEEVVNGVLHGQDIYD